MFVAEDQVYGIILHINIQVVSFERCINIKDFYTLGLVNPKV